jgi:uncharacterized delta-60 repeat protein
MLDDRCLLSGLLPGSLDPTFGAGAGFVMDPALQSAKATVVLPDKSILVGSSITNPTTGTNFVVRKYTAAGAVDQTFGTAGQVVTDFYGKNDQLEQLVVDTTRGRIYAVGEAQVVPTQLGSTQVSLAVAAYTLAGRIDASFGIGGKAVTPVVTGYTNLADQAESVMIDPQGRLIVAGMTTPSNAQHSYSANFLVRFLPQTVGNAGVLDGSFGKSGEVVGPMISSVAGAGLGAAKECWDTIACMPGTGCYQIATVGTNEGSSMSCKFSDTGAMIDAAPMTGPIGTIAYSPDAGRFVSVSTVNNGSRMNDIRVDVYSTASGKSLSTTTIDLASYLHVATSSETAAAVAVDAQGRIVVGGSVTGYNGTSVVLDRAFLMRLNPNGMLDTSFGSFGLVTTDFGMGKESFTQLVIQPGDGKIVATGATSSLPRMIVARYLGEPQSGGGGGGAALGAPATTASSPAIGVLTTVLLSSPVKKR